MSVSGSSGGQSAGLVVCNCKVPVSALGGILAFLLCAGLPFFVIIIIVVVIIIIINCCCYYYYYYYYYYYFYKKMFATTCGVHKPP